MNRSNYPVMFITFGAFFIFALSIPCYAQDQQVAAGELMPGFRRRALVMDIESQVLDEKKVVIWNETYNKTAIPGSPVNIKLVGSNVIVVVQFTHFVNRRGNVLVAQGQIWINDPDKGMSYYTSIQTIPMEFGEPIYFYPLGDSRDVEDSYIQIILTVKPNTAADNGVETAVNTGNDN
jgi:hypothetical protein